MRYFFVVLMVCMFVVSVNVASAAFEGPGAVPAISTTTQAKAAADDAAVVLEGTIIAKIEGKKDKYTFQDSTGTIVVEIEDKVFAGRTVTPAMKVRIYGEVDKELIGENEVEVKKLDIL